MSTRRNAQLFRLPAGVPVGRVDLAAWKQGKKIKTKRKRINGLPRKMGRIATARAKGAAYDIRD
jgi:hypothetical protein